MKNSLLRTDKEIVQIYNRHVNTVYKICYMYLKNKYDAEDATQTVFIKLINYKKQFENEEHEKAWLIVTASNTCKNNLKYWRHKVTKMKSFDEVDSSNVQKEIYDEFTNNFNDLFKMNSFDVLNNHKEEDIFYKTEHHYTTKAALYISEELYNKKIDYSKYIVNNSFYGTSANKIGYYNYSDTVELYVPNNDIKYYLTYNNEDTIYTSIYDKTKQYSYNPYEIFFGGNKSIIDIKTTSKNKEKLLLIKDSYANSFVPFILEEYQEIIIIDPRYYHDDLNNLINDKEITNIMLFYNMNTFFEDSSLDDLIENLKE